jgi:hypothetical protein
VRPARFDDVRTFCRVDGWVRKADAPGGLVRKHEVWTKELPDGQTLRAVVSKGRGEYAPPMMIWIVKHELRVTEQEFWRAVHDGVPPARPEARPQPPQGALLPHSLVRALLAAGHSPTDLRGLTVEQARRLLKEA